jgi:hypothetical protein
MVEKALIGQSIEKIYTFVSKTDGITPIDVTNPVFRVYDYKMVQIGTDLDLSGYRTDVGTYIFWYTVPNKTPYIYLEISAINNGDPDLRRETLETVFSFDNTNVGLMPEHTQDVNTYIEIDDANILAAQIMNAESWYQASTDDRIRSLIQATIHIDSEMWQGYKMVLTQKLQFPRYLPISEWDYNINTSDTDLVKLACVHEAIAILNGDAKIRSDLKHYGLKEIEINKNREIYFPGSEYKLYSVEAQRILRTYLLTSLNSEA